MERVLINDVKKYAGKDINIQGRILNVRKLGKVIFIILFDRSGEIQSVWSGDQDVKIGDIIVKSRKKKEQKAVMKSKVKKLILSPNPALNCHSTYQKKILI